MRLPTPSEFGAPARFSTWRHGQDRAFEALMVDKRRFQVLCLPTGTGKSLVYVAHALFEDYRTIILTSTKGLQDQLVRDFHESGMHDVRGMGNYECIAEGGTCDTASCTDGGVCHLKEKGCHYFDAVRKAEEARIVVSNYAFWFTRRRTHQGLGAFDLLVCDEAHMIPEEMVGYLSVWVRDNEVEWGPGADLRDHQGWRTWAKVALGGVNLGTARNKYERRKLKDLRERLTRLTEMEDDWVYERADRGWRFEPRWPTKYLEDWLWRKIPRVVLTSATIEKKTLGILGVQGEHFVEYDSPIPLRHRPVIYIPAARMDQRSLTEEGLWRWLACIDRIIEGRLDRKGIIHAVSYARAKYIMENSRWRDIMDIHESDTTRAVVERFKGEAPPRVLVSPSISTGWDFPNDTAHYQIITKVPFQPPSLLLKARTADDREYPYYLALMTMQQMAGRINRGPNEGPKETFVVDGMAGWLMARYGKFTARWFRKAWRHSEAIPEPPKMWRVA